MEDTVIDWIVRSAIFTLMLLIGLTFLRLKKQSIDQIIKSLLQMENIETGMDIYIFIKILSLALVFISLFLFYKLLFLKYY